MFRKALIATVALVVAGSGAALAGGYNTYNAEYRYQPQYKKVCEPVYETKYVYDSYSYRYVAKQVLVGERCFLVPAY